MKQTSQQRNGGDVGQGEMPGGQSSVLGTLSHELHWDTRFGKKCFILVFPFSLFMSARICGGWGVGVGVSVLFQSGLQGHPAEKVCFSI